MSILQSVRAMCGALAMVAGVLAGLTVAEAAPRTFFGEDLQPGPCPAGDPICETVRLKSHPNADAARAAFLAALKGVGTESFESFVDDTTAPVVLGFPGVGGEVITAILHGNGRIREITDPDGTNGRGRFPISGTKYYESASMFTVEFTRPIAAFGFYGTDIGDFDGRVTVTYTDGLTTTVMIPHTRLGLGGSVIYYGFIDVDHPFVSLTFGNTSSAGIVADAFGFDDMTIATAAQLDTPPPTTNNSGEPGSVLVFSKFVVGTVQVGTANPIPPSNRRVPILEPRSSFEISVTCPKDARCAEGQQVKLLARWICPGSPDMRQKFVCADTDFELFTTVKGTLSFNPENIGTTSLPPNHPPIPRPPCNRGYLIVWVVSPFDGSAPEAIKFDGLVGKAVIRSGANSVGAYAAVPIQAMDTLVTGAPTDVGDGFGGPPDGRLQFDGRTEYKALTGQLTGSLRYERVRAVPKTTLGTIETSLVLLTLNVRSNRPNLPTFVDLHFYNEHEVLISAMHAFTCWSEVRLTAIDANLSEFFGEPGLIETKQAVKESIFGIGDFPGRVTLLGLVETVERNANGGIIAEYEHLLNSDGFPVFATFEHH